MLVLWPVALLCVYGISKAIGGRGFAYLATLAWVVFPLATIPYFYGRYHVKLVDQTLPVAQGLVATGDFPSMVLFSSRRTRAASGRAARCGAVAGLAAARGDDQGGELVLLRLPAPSPCRGPSWRALLVSARVRRRRRARALEVPGTGTIRPSPTRRSRLALGASSPPPVAEPVAGSLPALDSGNLRDNMYQVRESTWSANGDMGADRRRDRALAALGAAASCRGLARVLHLPAASAPGRTSQTAASSAT